MDDRTILTVSELNSAIRTLLENRFPFVSVAGEISNMHKPFSGHLYFTLKDSGGQLKAVLFKMQQRYLARPPKDGEMVVCRGRLSVYEPRGDYQLIIDTIDYQGIGALQQAYEHLKKKLAAEGLFDEHLKRPLPAFPQHIVLLTSPRGAAVHDFIRIATRRFPGIRLSVYPVSVQGEQAPGELIAALQSINNSLPADVAVLCRGGGSIEDLWAFNDEHLARAIRACQIPVVSAIGHEVDFTIADFAADLRAPTPSGAAELLLPDATTLREQLSHLKKRLTRALKYKATQEEQRLELLREKLERMPYPLEKLLFQVDQLGLTLSLTLQQQLAAKKRQVDTLRLHLEQNNPVHQLRLQGQRLKTVHNRVFRAMQKTMKEKQLHLAGAASTLQAVSPLATLARGYAIVSTTQKRRKTVITQASQVTPGEQVQILLHQGVLQCTVEEQKKEKEAGESSTL